MYLFIYHRIDPHVSLSAEGLRDAFNEYADAHIKGGRAALTKEHYAGVQTCHDDAFLLYGAVMSGQL